MGGVSYKNFGQLSLSDVMVYQSIPPHPFWDKVNEVIDFSFVDKICEPLYSPLGQRPYAPSLKLKIHLVQRYYDISDREMELKIIGDIFVKRFLELPVTHSHLDHSTIGLDRNRLGAEMFHACHVFILAQALDNGLWGDEDDRWLVDSFHTHASVATPSTFELIQQAAQKVIRHLKKKNPERYTQLKKHIDVGAFFRRLKRDVVGTKRNVAFSKLVVQAYGLTAWQKRIDTNKQFLWDSPEEKKISEKHCELLTRVLYENTIAASQDGSNDDGDGHSGTSEAEPAENDAPLSDEADLAQYVELSKDQKPSDRIVSAVDPDIRCGYKTKKKMFIGDKVQVVESLKSKLVLNAEPIQGNESDGTALEGLVSSVVEEYGKRPAEVVADSAYGWGENREKLKGRQILLTAPMPKTSNPAGNLFHNSEFQYLPEQQVVICPAGQTSYRHAHIKKSQGTQHIFAKGTCGACPLRAQCTTGNSGRTVFINDYWQVLQEAEAYNLTPEGKAALLSRYEIERTNNEMKRHHGLERPRTHGRDKLRISVKLTSMVVNIKVMVKAMTKQLKPKVAPVCP